MAVGRISVGEAVGAVVGSLVGDFVGTAVGDAVGTGIGDVVGEGVAVGTAVGVAVRYLAVTTVEVTSPQPLSPETPSMPKLNSANVGLVDTLLLSESYPLVKPG